MNEITLKVCESLLDALDRLFDRESEVIDIYALVFVSHVALGTSVVGLDLSNLAIELDQISKNGEVKELQRTEALQITNNLRVTLNDLLPI